MNGRIRIRVRGIYATALSALLRDLGFLIVDPSLAVLKRLGLQAVDDEEDITITDQDNRQGIIIAGQEDSVPEVVDRLRTALPCALFQQIDLADSLAKGYTAEFPSTVKSQLDEIRARHTLTLPGHHCLKVCDPARVDAAETAAAEHPNDLAELSLELKKNLVLSTYRTGREILIGHLKAGSGGFYYRAKFQEIGTNLLKLHRQFKGGGTFDSLDVKREQGDFGTLEFYEGAWYFRRAYFDRDGALKGELYNINTPVEFYPDHIRYVDFELDVVRFPDGTVKIVDEDVLEEKTSQGLISSRLAERSWENARQVLKTLSAFSPASA